MGNGVSPITRERQTTFIETGYHIGSPVDELKPHLAPEGDKCTTLRGKVILTFNQGRSALIQCDCKAIVQEAI